MPRRLSQKDQDFAIERLIANRGDVALTAKELNLSTATIYRLRKSRIDSQFSFATFSSNSSQPASNSINSDSLLPHTEGLPPDDLQALRDLKAKMLELVAYIVAADKIKIAIDTAPLNQRIAALVQLTDRIIKLAAELPIEEDDEMELSDDVEEVDDEEDA